MHRLWHLALVVLSLSTTGHCALILTISPDGGGTRWEFNGSATYSGNSTTPFNGGFWLAPFSSEIANTQIGTTPSVGGAILRNESRGELISIEEVFVNTPLNELGVQTTNVNESIRYEDGNTISWTGVETVAVSFSSFNPGVHTGSVFINVNGSLPIEVTVVPEPSTYCLVTLAALAGIAYRRRKRSAA